MLALNFASTFSPERHYLSLLLKLFKTHKKSMTVSEISDATGIPQGKSSGKVSPHIKYLLGMNLIEQNEDGGYKITAFGKSVYSFDKSLSEPITAWACHAFLCDDEDGAIIYREAIPILAKANELSREALVDGIERNIDSKVDDGVIAPFIGFYKNDTAFSDAHIIDVEDKILSYNSCPMSKSFIPLYGAFVCYYLEKYFSDKEQVSLPDFASRTELCSRFNLSESSLKSLMDILAGEGYIKISHLVNPLVISRLKETEECMEDLYKYVV